MIVASVRTHRRDGSSENLGMMYFVELPRIGDAIALHDGVESHMKWQVVNVEHWPQTHEQAQFGYSNPKVIVFIDGFGEFGLPQY